MKKALSTLIIALVTGCTTLSAQSFQWAKSMGGADADIGNSIALDASGNIYTTGTYEGIVDFDPGAGTFNLTSAGNDDIFISKLDASGNFVWAKSMGGADADIGYSIALDASGNLYTTGYYAGTVDFDPGAGTFNLTSLGISDLFILKLDASGNFVWAKSMGGAGNVESTSIALDASGNIYTTGTYEGIVDFDPGAGTFNITSAGFGDIFISKLDASGNFVWAKSMGGAVELDRARSIVIDASGNVYTTGHYGGTVDFDPGAGTFNLTSIALYDIFISKLDASGNFVWAIGMGGPDYDGGGSITLDASGNVYTTGYYFGTIDFDPGAGTFNLTSLGISDLFILKLDASGNFIWAKSMGGVGPNGVGGLSIVPDASGNVYTTGVYEGTVDFDPDAGTFNLTTAGLWDVFISKLDVSGNFVWAIGMGGGDDDVGFSIALDASGNVYSTGYYSATVDFDPGAGIFNLTSTGIYDIFISKLSNSPVGFVELAGNENIQVYPNPTSDLIYFAAPTNVQLFNAIGQIITDIKQVSAIDISNQPAGLYFLSLTENSGQVIQRSKFLKQ